MDLHPDSDLHVPPSPELPVTASAVASGTPQSRHTLQRLTDRLSHRLLGLVNSIEGYTDLLTQTLGTTQQRELSLRILEGASRIERVIQDLRRFSESIDPVVRSITVRQLLDGLRDLIGPEDWLHIDVAWALAERPHELLVDPVLLRQALLVLVKNAFEATPDRTIRLEVSADVAVQSTRFSVWNEGSVDVPNPHEQLFEPFFGTKGQHMGLGLVIARRIVDAHGGALELAYTSEEDGTCFTVDLPHAHGGTSDDYLVLRTR